METRPIEKFNITLSTIPELSITPVFIIRQLKDIGGNIPLFTVHYPSFTDL